MITRFISALYRRVAGTAGPPLLLPRGAGGTPLAGSGRNGRMRGFAGQSKQLSPHPPLRGTFSRGEKVGSPRPFLIAVCNARANRARTGRRDMRVAREPERPCRFRRDCRLESRLTNSRLIHSSIRAGGGEQRSHRWYRQAKETKCGEMGGRESQCLIVAMKRGNEPSRTPGSEGGAASWTGVATTPRTPSLKGVSPRNRLAVLRDSGATT